MKKILILTVLCLVMFATAAMASANKQNFLSTTTGKMFFGGSYSITTALVDDGFSGNFSALEGSFSYLLSNAILVDVIQERLQSDNPDLSRLTISYVYNRTDLEQKLYIGGGLMTKWFDVTDTRLGGAIVGGVLWPSDDDTGFKLGGKYGYFGGDIPEQRNVFGLEIGVYQKF